VAARQAAARRAVSRTRAFAGRLRPFGRYDERFGFAGARMSSRKVTAITGGAQGIGRAIAWRFASAG
jgi:hypothetical protein